MKQRVACAKHIERPALEVWQEVREFARNWHPWVTKMWAEPGHIRAFRVNGEETVYREQLTWRSDSEMQLGYRHVAGIAGAKSYSAKTSVQGHGPSCKVEMSASIEATDPDRAQAIAAGTRQVFDAGLQALAHPPVALHGIAGTPNLSILATRSKPGVVTLFLHGIGGQATNWDPQLPIAAKFGRGVALDFRGYGDSDLGADQTTVADHMSDIDRVRVECGTEKLVLVGLSMGAWLATAYATTHPDRVAGLIVAGGCTGMSEAPDTVRSEFRTARLGPLAEGQTPADFAETVICAIAGPTASTRVLTEMKNSMSAISSRTYEDAVTCFTTPPGPHAFDRLTCPVLLVTGEHDPLAPPHEILAIAKRIQTASGVPVRFEALMDSGHICNLEAAPSFNTLLQDFLSEISV